jgi:hypothetical protein
VEDRRRRRGRGRGRGGDSLHDVVELRIEVVERGVVVLVLVLVVDDTV